jgi:hypothetical protein
MYNNVFMYFLQNHRGIKIEKLEQVTRKLSFLSNSENFIEIYQ